MTSSSILYGTTASLYTGKVRSYLRKQGIPFEERPAGDPRFFSQVLPQIGRWIVPVVQLPDGTLVQDGAVILDHFEANADLHRVTTRPRATPPDRVLAVLAHLFELFGGEGLLRPAMHFRWNFDADNLEFLRADFSSSLAPGHPPAAQEAMFEMASKRMRSATKAFGVTPDVAGLVEASAIEFLQCFNRHLATVPYVLGSSPTYGDYGLIAPLFAHLGRDPYPAAMMKRRAPRVWRWVERMNAPDADAGEYLGQAPGEAFEALLRFIAQDYLPELEAQVSYANEWLAARPELPAGTNGLPKPGDRSLGSTVFQWRGQEMKVLVMPYRLFMLQRVQDAVLRLNESQTTTLRELLSRTGLGPLLTLRCRRRVMRQGHFEVWGPTQPDLLFDDGAPGDGAETSRII
jgi:glutathione S-transferase